MEPTPKRSSRDIKHRLKLLFQGYEDTNTLDSLLAFFKQEDCDFVRLARTVKLQSCATLFAHFLLYLVHTKQHSHKSFWSVLNALFMQEEKIAPSGFKHLENALLHYDDAFFVAKDVVLHDNRIPFSKSGTSVKKAPRECFKTEACYTFAKTFFPFWVESAEEQASRLAAEKKALLQKLELASKVQQMVEKPFILPESCSLQNLDRYALKLILPVFQITGNWSSEDIRRLVFLWWKSGEISKLRTVKALRFYVRVLRINNYCRKQTTMLKDEAFVWTVDYKVRELMKKIRRQFNPFKSESDAKRLQLEMSNTTIFKCGRKTSVGPQCALKSA